MKNKKCKCCWGTVIAVLVALLVVGILLVMGAYRIFSYLCENAALDARTFLLGAACLLLAVVLWKLNKPRNGGDYEELKRWMQQQLDAQAKDFAARQAAMAEQNYTAIRSVSETLQTSVQSMSTTLAQGQSGQQQIPPVLRQ